MTERFEPLPLIELQGIYRGNYEAMTTFMADEVAQFTRKPSARFLTPSNHIFFASTLLANLPDLTDEIYHIERYGITGMEAMFDFADNLFADLPQPEDIEFARKEMDVINKRMVKGLTTNAPKLERYRSFLAKYIALDALVENRVPPPLLEFRLVSSPKLPDSIVLHTLKSNPLRDAREIIGPAGGRHVMLRPGIFGMDSLNLMHQFSTNDKAQIDFTIVENDPLGVEILTEYLALLGNPRMNVIEDNPLGTNVVDGAAMITMAQFGDLDDDQIVTMLQNAARGLAPNGVLIYRDNHRDQLVRLASRALGSYLTVERKYNNADQTEFEIWARKEIILPPLPPPIALAA